MLEIAVILFSEPLIVVLSNGLYIELSQLTAEHWVYERLSQAATTYLDQLKEYENSPPG